VRKITIYQKEILKRLNSCQKCKNTANVKKYYYFDNSFIKEKLLCKTCYSKLKTKIKCSFCGSSYEDYEKNGLLGCEHCYKDLSIFLFNIILTFQNIDKCELKKIISS